MSSKHCMPALSTVFCALLLVTTAFAQPNSTLQGTLQSGPLTLKDGEGRAAHMFPTLRTAHSMGLVGRTTSVDNGPLTYNGGPIMPAATIYEIFWLPSTGKLQDGVTATSFSAKYQTVLHLLAARWSGHPLDTVLGQYYSGSTTKTYILPTAVYGGAVVDTHPYPTSGCSNSVSGANCITDTQIQAEIANQMTAHGWTASASKIFVLFTSSGEGSCFGSTESSGCAYTAYCGYHSFTGSTIYANIPYGDPNYCQVPGTPSPNADVPADTAASITSHELSEAISDPHLDAWYTFQGNENGDLCAYNYGLNGWDAGKANQFWAGSYFELQMEWNNHTGQCVQVGP